jgi:ankyrin repeat protein
MENEEDFVVVFHEDVQGYVEQTITDEDLLHLQNWLSPTEYLSPGSEYKKHLSSYVSGTGQSLRDSESFQAWDNSKDVGCLWVKGIPGSGKSVWAAATAKQLIDREQGPVVFFFFRQIVAVNHDPHYLVRDWLSQLLPHSPLLQASLTDMRRGGRSIDKTPIRMLWGVLRSALLAMSKVYCIADALDEMDDNNDTFVSQLFELAGVSPRSVKVLLTSRPIPRIEAIFRKSIALSISLEPSALYQDITRYVDDRLDTLDITLHQERKQAVKDAICTHAAGLFLYARLLTDNLRDRSKEGIITEDSLPDSLETLPRNLKELYTEMLAEHSIRTGVSKEVQYTLLQLVTHSSRPLRVLELGAVVSFMKESTSLKQGKELARACCGQLLEILEDETVSIIHHSFTKFLTDLDRIDENNESRDPRLFPVIESKETNKMLALTCLEYLASCTFSNRGKLEPASGGDYEYYDYQGNYTGSKEDRLLEEHKEELRLKHAFLSYAADNWHYHVKNADPSILRELGRFIGVGKPALITWLRFCWPSYCLDNVTPAHVAAYLGMEDYLQYIIAMGKRIDEKDGCWKTPLMYAVEGGHTDILRILLKGGANARSDDRLGHQPIHFAARNNYVEIVKLLMAHGSMALAKKSRNTPGMATGIDTSDVGETAFQYACIAGHAKVMSEFVPQVDRDNLCRGLSWVAARHGAEAITVILGTGQVPIDVLVGGKTALFRACSNLNEEAVRVLLEHGANPNYSCPSDSYYDLESHNSRVQYNQSDELGRTPLHAFAGIGSTHRYSGQEENAKECLQLLVQARGNLETVDKHGKTLLHLACEGGDNDSSNVFVVRLLLGNGADVSKRTNSGETVLHLVSGSDPDVVDILVSYGAKLEAVNQYGRTPLHHALQQITSGYSEKALVRLLHHGADPNAVTERGNTALHILLRKSTVKLNVFRALIKAGADINRKNKDGVSPLMEMKMSRKYKEILQDLVDAGIDVMSVDPEGSVAIYRLLENDPSDPKTLQKLKTLLDDGCSVLANYEGGKTILHHAISCGAQVDVLNVLLKAGANPLAVDSKGNTLMHEIASRERSSTENYVRIFKRLLAVGVPYDTTNSDGQTPLHLSCINQYHNGSGEEDRNQDFMNALLDNTIVPRVDVNAADNEGNRPLHHASFECEYHVGRLLRAGADIAVLNSKEQTPLHCASQSHESNIISILLSELSRKGLLETHIDKRDVHGRTALHYACQQGRPESVRCLLENGASHASQDNKGHTPMHALAKFKRSRIRKRFMAPLPTSRPVEIIEMLLNSGANMQAIDQDGMTPFEIAKSNSSIEVINELYYRNVDLNDEIPESISSRDIMQEAVSLLASIKGKQCLLDQTRSILDKGDFPLFRELVRRGANLAEVAQYGGTPLHNLAEAGYSTFLEENLGKVRAFEHPSRSGVSISRGEEFTAPLLYEACRSELPNMAVVKLLVEKVAVNINRKAHGGEKKLEGGTALHVAAVGSHFWNIEAVKYLIEAGANLESLNSRGETPLLVAVSADWPSGFWKEDIIRILLDAGANPLATSGDKDNCLTLSDHSNITKVFLERGIDIARFGQRALNSHIDRLDVGSARMLLQAGVKLVAPVNKIIGKVDELDDFEAKGDNESVTDDESYDYKPYGAGLNENSDTSPWLDLHEKYLLRDSIHPLHRAALPKDYPQDWEDTASSMVELLIKGGLSANDTYPDGSTIPQLAMEQNGVVEAFLPHYDLNRQGRGGRSLLHSALRCIKTENFLAREACRPSGRPDKALVLLDRGAGTQAVDNLGRNALHYLCITPLEFSDIHKKLFFKLIELSPGLVNQTDKYGRLPLHCALQSPQLSTVKHLLDIGEDLNAVDGSGNTALHHLAKLMSRKQELAEEAGKLFEYALSLGALINACNADGDTPLFTFMACKGDSFRKIGRQGQFYIFRNAGVDTQARNNRGETVLHVMAKRSVGGPGGVMSTLSEELEANLEDLMALGIDTTVEDNQQRTALDVSIASANSTFSSYLANRGSKTSRRIS